SERPSSPAAAHREAANQTRGWAAVRLSGRCTPAGAPLVSSDGGVAGRLFGQVRFDLLLQISPSVSDHGACYVLRLGPLIPSFLLAGLRGGPRDCVAV